MTPRFKSTVSSGRDRSPTRTTSAHFALTNNLDVLSIHWIWPVRDRQNQVPDEAAIMLECMLE